MGAAGGLAASSQLIQPIPAGILPPTDWSNTLSAAAADQFGLGLPTAAVGGLAGSSPLGLPSMAPGYGLGLADTGCSSPTAPFDSSPHAQLGLPSMAPSFGMNSIDAGFGSPTGPYISSPHALLVDPRSLGSFGSFGSSSTFSPGAGGMQPGGGSLSGFVSLATYQEQMQSVAKLHGQVGQMAVQLREAHADAEGAQQLLQQERQVRPGCNLSCQQDVSLLLFLLSYRTYWQS